MIAARAPTPDTPSQPSAAGVAIEVLDLGHAGDRRRFVATGEALGAADPCHVSGPRRERRYRLDPGGNLLFSGLRFQAFIARRGGRPRARLLAYQRQPGSGEAPDDTGWFGFFDAADDGAAVSALLRQAGRWLEQGGARFLVGPVDLVLDEGAGLQIDGFERPPSVGLHGNPPHVVALLEAAGFRSRLERPTWSWCLQGLQADPRAQRALAQAQLLRQRPDLKLRAVDLTRISDEVPRWYALWRAQPHAASGPGPRDEAAFAAWVHEHTRHVLPGLLLACEEQGQLVGISATLADVNRLMPRSGRLSPLANLRLGRAGRHLSHAGVRSLLVAPSHRGQGIEGLLLAESGHRAGALGIRGLDVPGAWQDDRDRAHALRQLGAKIRLRHRIFRVELDQILRWGRDAGETFK